MFQTLKNAWKTPELKTKLLFTLIIVILYRLGASIMVPWIDPAATTQMVDMYSGTVLEYLSLLSGGALTQATLFALSVSPYITASIVMQLLTIAIPKLEQLSKEGEEGKKKISAITRLVTIALALITSFGYTLMIMSQGGGMTTLVKLTNSGYTWANGNTTKAFNLIEIFKNGAGLQFVTIVACYCAGAALVMWLAEKINEKGIGNGISIILFANILSGIPSTVANLWALASTPFKAGVNEGFHASMIVAPAIALLIVAIVAAAVYFIVWFTNSERRIPVQYAKRVVGRKMYGGQNSNIPLKVNMAGVMPIIFANAILTLPSTIAMIFTPEAGSFWEGVVNFFSNTSPVYAILQFVLILAFAYFYVAISFNPTEVSGNIQKNGGAVPGIRPGKATADFIKKVLSKVTFIGAISLSIIAVLPLVAYLILNALTGIDAAGAAATFTAITSYASELAFSGTSVVIVVGVIIETVKEIEAQMTMRNYKGFLG